MNNIMLFNSSNKFQNNHTITQHSETRFREHECAHTCISKYSKKIIQTFIVV